MAKLSSMYGTDDNDFASSIASKALGDPSPNAHSGAPIDQEARSVGSKGKRLDGTEDKFPVGREPNSPASAKNVGGGKDSRAVSKGDCPK